MTNFANKQILEEKATLRRNNIFNFWMEKISLGPIYHIFINIIRLQLLLLHLLHLRLREKTLRKIILILNLGLNLIQQLSEGDLNLNISIVKQLWRFLSSYLLVNGKKPRTLFMLSHNLLAFKRWCLVQEIVLASKFKSYRLIG